MPTQSVAKTIEPAMYETLAHLGYAVDADPNMIDTPERAAKWFASFAWRNVEEDLRAVLTPVFPDEHKELVLVKDISFVALCAHHMLPYHGLAHIGYVPRDGVVGISKLARAVKLAAHQLTLQERITHQLADGIYDVLGCQGVMVVLTDVEHACMSFRGVEDVHARTTTSAVRGIFASNQDGIKDEFLSLIARR